MNQNTSTSFRRASTLRRACIGTAALSLGVVGIAACGSDEGDPAIESVPGSVLDTTAPVDTMVTETMVVDTMVDTTTAP
jgi:hypothetical protein